MSWSSDLWPRLRPFEETTPVMASFQVRQTSAGLEIWDPQQLVSLASADRDGWFQDEAAKHGVQECHPESWMSSGCEGRELVEFEPPLPAAAVSSDKRKEVDAISSVPTWLKYVLGILFFCGMWVCCVMVKSSRFSR
eukprot:TRINITY_DN19085_c0_g1_i1.p2 TRINITY_DN19085_c0_g1~~TRINITY_DN19085_c0_g1_i1.p2  ORF type:complete len:137 (+),score=20.90 TRINITY_DN19085_c0_g1_i1:658-1068(+)